METVMDVLREVVHHHPNLTHEQKAEAAKVLDKADGKEEVEEDAGSESEVNA